MPKQIHTKGQKANSDDSIIKLKQTIIALGFHIVEQSYSNPIDNIWSISISERDCPQLTSIGVGINKRAALLNALQLFLENLATHYFWINYYLGDELANSKFVHSTKEKWFDVDINDTWPENVLNDELRTLYNPVGELNINNLIDIRSSNIDRGICCIPFQNLLTKDEIYFPLNIVDNLYVNNGSASGSTAEKARVNALCNILKNYVQFKVIAEGISLPDVPNAFLDRFPQLQKTINEIEQAGFSLLLKDASFNGKYPVVNIILLNPKDQGICNSFASNPIFELALESCLIQILKEFDLKTENILPEAGFDMDEIASAKNLEQQFNKSRGITAWDSLKNNSNNEYYDWSNEYSKLNDNEIFKQLCKIIQAEGNDIFIAEYNDHGIYTCKVLVPSMSEIYPVDDLVWENNNAGINVRDRILEKNKSIQDCERLIEDLEDLDLDDELLVSKLIGMSADKDSIFHDLCVAELILLLALKTQDNERMQEGCEWILDYQQTNLHRLKTYKCINTILQLDGMTDYGVVLEKLYTREALNDALALIAGEDVFPLDSEWKEHSLLIEAYKKIIST